MPAALELTDPHLTALAGGGDQAAYGQLVSRHQTLVVSIAYSICGDFSRSQDIAQEAFVAAWRQLDTLDDPAKFKSWLCGITRNLAHNFVRQRTRRGDQPGAFADAEQQLIANAPSPHEQMVTREEAAIVWRALEQLPDTYREPLILFYRELHSIERVAAALDLSTDMVKQRLSRGRGMLRDQVEGVVERSLGSTTPTVLFTSAVLGALPVLVKPTIATGSAATVVHSVTLAKTCSGLVKLLPSFLVSLAAAYGGHYWQSKRGASSPKRFFLLALVLWGIVAAAVGFVWLIIRR